MAGRLLFEESHISRVVPGQAATLSDSAVLIHGDDANDCHILPNFILSGDS
jgi:hypothetical protein